MYSQPFTLFIANADHFTYESLARLVYRNHLRSFSESELGMRQINYSTPLIEAKAMLPHRLDAHIGHLGFRDWHRDNLVPRFLSACLLYPRGRLYERPTPEDPDTQDKFVVVNTTLLCDNDVFVCSTCSVHKDGVSGHIWAARGLCQLSQITLNHLLTCLPPVEALLLSSLDVELFTLTENAPMQLIAATI